MTVKELMELLEDFDPTLEVVVEGIDNRHFCKVENPHVIEMYNEGMEQSDYADPREMDEEMVERFKEVPLKQGVFLI